MSVLVVSLAAADGARWADDFSEGRLDASRWQRTVDGDFRQWSVDVVDAGLPGAPDFRLRLRGDTRGARDDTVKHLGVRTTRPIRLRDGARIAVRMYWSDHVNTSYLTGAVILSPHATLTNPLDTSDWLKVAYIGVPPLRKARMLVASRSGGRDRTVYTEGWPEVNQDGRRIEAEDIALSIREGFFEVREGERLIWVSTPNEMSAGPVYLYLQMSSHSNYPARALAFDNVRVDEGSGSVTE